MVKQKGEIQRPNPLIKERSTKQALEDLRQIVAKATSEFGAIKSIPEGLSQMLKRHFFKYEGERRPYKLAAIRKFYDQEIDRKIEELK